jgi:glyoxylase-like metal-dependent hydrolase (beta-lactamase superfamily II)
MRIGALDVAVVSDGLLLLDPARLFGRVDEAEWRPLAETDDHGFVPAGVNCVLVRSGERNILLDTGTGRELAVGRGQACGRVLDSLDALGVKAEEIDTVVLSHAHWDHAGGATVPAGDGRKLTFPNADYWMWRGEWDYWSRSDIADRPEFLEYTLPTLERSEHLQLTESEVEVAPGVRVITAPGHTPGHVCVALTSGSEMAVYTGDMFHHPSQVEHPEWSPLFDVLPEVSVETRRRIFEQARREGSVLLTAHLPTPGVVRLPASGGIERLA